MGTNAYQIRGNGAGGGGRGRTFLLQDTVVVEKLTFFPVLFEFYFPHYTLSSPRVTNIDPDPSFTHSLLERKVLLDLQPGETAAQDPALGFLEPVPIVQIPPPAWEVGGPEKASQKGELFESSVIQKRPFNVRTWGAEENVGGIAVNYLKQRGSQRRGKRREKCCFLGLNLRRREAKRSSVVLKRGVSEHRGLGKFDPFMRSMFLRVVPTCFTNFRHKCSTLDRARSLLQLICGLISRESCVFWVLDHFFTPETTLIAAFVLFFFPLIDACKLCHKLSVSQICCARGRVRPGSLFFLVTLNHKPSLCLRTQPVVDWMSSASIFFPLKFSSFFCPFSADYHPRTHACVWGSASCDTSRGSGCVVLRVLVVF